MARTITQYRIFIGSPGGLAAERKLFRYTVAKFNTSHARQHQIEFEAVGWEDTLPGVGRPQAMINEDLEQCDYAIFVFHDRWGSSTGNGDLVGTEEEWQIAERRYAEYKLRQMALFFKTVPLAQEKDPGEEFKRVLAFKRQIFDGKKHLCGAFKKPRDFGGMVEKHLAKWLADHIKTPDDRSLSEPQSYTTQGATVSPAPTFAYWRDEAWKAMEEPNKDYSAGLAFANRAVDAASDADELSEALHARGYAHFNRGEYPESLASNQAQIEALAGISTEDTDERIAKALFDKGVLLSHLDRHEKAIAAYDEVIKRFGDSDAEALREQVAKALLNKGITLNNLGRRDEKIAVYDDLIARYGDSNVDQLRIQVASALFTKALTFDGLEAIAIYDDMIKRYDDSEAESLREQVAKGLFWKACELANLKQLKSCIATLDAWAEKRGGFDCDAVAEKAVFFSHIQDDPEFAAYLARKGCVAG
jgi:tetratricopeptide (TPR) repeat protein